MKKNEKLFREYRLRQLEGEGNERKFEISFSSEEPYERYWGVEILDHGENSVNLERLNEIGCVLFNHNRDKVIGKIVQASVEKGRGTAVIEIDEDQESEIYFQKMKSGTLKGVSVGYAVYVWEEVSAGKSSSDGKYTGQCSIARKWEPMEISIVSIPADATVGVGREMEDEKSRYKLDLYEKQLLINHNLTNF